MEQWPSVYHVKVRLVRVAFSVPGGFGVAKHGWGQSGIELSAPWSHEIDVDRLA